MRNIDPSTSSVEEHKKESEEEGVLLVTEKDLKDGNIDTNAKMTAFDALVEVCHVAYKNLKKKKGDEKQKKDAILPGVSEYELKKNLYFRKDSALKRSYAQCKSDSGLKEEEKPRCGLGPLLADLPLKVRERIASMEGKDVELVVEKQLYPTDMNDTNSRLSIPVRQVVAKEFLKDEEKRALVDGDCLKVKILEPSLEMVSDMNLKQWNMFKEKGNVSSSYVFITHWNSLRRRNHLRLFDRVQVWSFRVENDLYFALVKVDGEGGEQGNCSSGSNAGAATASQAGVAGHGGNGSASNNSRLSIPVRQRT
ncbi:DOMAIN PROTEIN putative (DUF313)-RELATED [Salix viminalis]|uniref:DOMAIN PROTEIN putative (DUF313)-RELATED n=1 Tax=Salix viminalis TaxID=40686 RepID=A0A6N2LPT4_SALVM|nr:DOMAIN PROTEIN putative (DUF313)-RELATED [Salix viminalis]